MYKNVYKYDEMKRAEHMAVRENVGWYLFTHEIIEVTGKDAAAFLDYACPRPIGTLEISKARYTTILDNDGIIRDDVVVFRMDECVFWVSTLYTKKTIPWFEEIKGDYDVQFANITPSWDMYSIQGPRSLELANEILDEPVDDLKFFQIKDNALAGIPVKVSRGGFTGEQLGFELYISPQHTTKAVELLRTSAPKFGGIQVTDIQIMVWTLPTEKGYYLMCDLSRANPFEVGLEIGIDWDKDFVGKAALLKLKESGPARKLFGFTVDEEDVFIPARNIGGPGTPVMVDGEERGRVTKMTYSYVNDQNIGYALADATLKPGDKIYLRGFEAVLCELPFVK